ncbi:MAG: PilZ domain-containing protein [Treponema sp.]|jgi:hypothetical protein|nr:PilZ domain-containing protein [Treponema sp.]
MFGNTEQRKNRRFPSSARARIPGAFSGDALLKDLSITGCRIECTEHADVQEKKEYAITIYPEDVSGIGKFDLLGECEWLNPGTYSCDIGFDIKRSPTGKVFQRYVDYLTWRSSTS